MSALILTQTFLEEEVILVQYVIISVKWLAWLAKNLTRVMMFCLLSLIKSLWHLGIVWPNLPHLWYVGMNLGATLGFKFKTLGWITICCTYDLYPKNSFFLVGSMTPRLWVVIDIGTNVVLKEAAVW